MGKKDPNRQNLFEFDEQGANQVGEQIMDAYNIGFIDTETTIDESDEFFSAEG
jgi:hypothetical protein